MRNAKIVKGTYAGRIGKVTMPNEYGLVMFYPIEGEYPYRTCVALEDIEYV